MAIYNWMDHVLNSEFEKGTKFLPPYMCPTKFLSISFQGFVIKPFEFTAQNRSINEVLQLCQVNIREIRNVYDKDWLFERPSIAYIPAEEKFILSIAMMEKKHYKELVEKKK